ncbi:MAG: alpha/beta hydrolase [Clostridia bacterium]|nr:alpha/beta hydrolase [Clostridia bacterium]
MSSWAIFGIIIASTIALLAFFYVMIGILFYELSIRRKTLIGKLVLKTTNDNLQVYKIDREWWNRQNVEELEVYSGKDRLVGYLIRNKKKTNKVAIIAHGYYVSHLDINNQARIFLNNGFNVFAPDMRAHGNSGGKTIGMGALDKGDMLLWINKMIDIFGKRTKIALFGLSMGGATVCLVSGENIPKNVKCIISDCAYDSLFDQFKNILNTKMFLPTYPIMNISCRFVKLIGNYDIKSTVPRDAVKKAKIPILFVHGTVDEFVPSYMVKKLYNESNKRKCELYLVKGAGHAMAYATEPRKYTKRIVDFVNKHIK